MSTPSHHPHRGFTLVELSVVLAVVALLAGLAASSLARQRPRAGLASAAAELQALIHSARAAALGSGQDVGVLVFPAAAIAERSTGRVVVYQDGNFDFFTSGAVNFADYDPAALPAGDRSQVIATLDLPPGVVVGPATGLGASASLPAPLDGVDVTQACSFCEVSGAAPRGAIRFDARGRASFYRGKDRLTVTGGASLSLTASEVGGVTTLAILASTGAVHRVSGG